jgi:hypothetical protein
LLLPGDESAARGRHRVDLLKRPAGAARADQPDVEGDHDHGGTDHGEQGRWPGTVQKIRYLDDQYRGG